MAVEATRVEVIGAHQRPVAEERRTVQPALVWAGIGALFVGLQLYVHGSWIISGDARHIGTGVTPLPWWWVVLARVQEVAWGAGIIAMLYFFAWRPWRRTGRMSFDGLFVMAFFFVWWQDIVPNYLTTEFTFNAMWINLGGWGNHIPGWVSPNAQNNPEPLIYEIGFYMFVSAAGAILGCKLMSRWLRRWPRLPIFWAFAILYVLICIADVILELFYAFTGAYVYGGNPTHLMVFQGRFYQFPIYEPFLIGFLVTGWTAVRWFRNDRGESLAERGIEKLKVGHKTKTGLRFLCIAGALNVVFLVTYNIPIQFFQMHPGTWPEDIQKRSYFMNGICGTGTDYACPGSDIPLPTRRGSSAHFTPDGGLMVGGEPVVPAGTPQLPQAPPFATTDPGYLPPFGNLQPAEQGRDGDHEP